MSNFKEYYPHTNFREDLYRMDILKKDKYESLVYQGSIDEAPLAASYVYQPEEHIETISGKNTLRINNGMNALVKKIKLKGDSHYDLPDEYIKLYYLESTGTQWIDTGIMGVGSIESHAKFAFTNTPTSYYMLAGVRNGGSNRCYIFNVNDAGHWGLGYISTLAELTSEKPIINKIYNGYCKLSAGAQEIILNNDRYVKSYGGTLNINYSIYVFGLHYINGGQVNCSARLYSFDLWVNGELKRNFIPVKRKSDEELGLYDLVTGTFFTNQGTGTFIAGPEMSGGTVDHPVDILSIGSYNVNNNMWETIVRGGNIKVKLEHEQPLCSVGDNCVDLYDDGVLYYHTQYTELSPVLNWEIDNAYSSNDVLVVSLFTPNMVKKAEYLYCSHFSQSDDLSVPNHIKIDNQRIYLSLDRNDFLTLDIFIEWLSNNKVILIYPRKMAKKVNIEPKITLMTYESATNFSNDQNAWMELQYPVKPNCRVWKRQDDGTFIELT